jgi:hypothetical protein
MRLKKRFDLQKKNGRTSSASSPDTIRSKRKLQKRSAEWHSAVSPIGNRQGSGNFESHRSLEHAAE